MAKNINGKVPCYMRRKLKYELHPKYNPRIEMQALYIQSTHQTLDVTKMHRKEKTEMPQNNASWCSK